MPGRDGTGPQGQGPGTGRLGGDCAAGRGNNPNKVQGRRNGSGNGLRGTGGGGRGANNPNNTQNKQN